MNHGQIAAHLKTCLNCDLTNFRRSVLKHGKYDKDIEQIANGDENLTSCIYELLEKVVHEVDEYIDEQEEIIERTNTLVEGFVMGVMASGSSANKTDI